MFAGFDFGPPGAICGKSLFLVLVLPRGLFSRFSGFPLSKNQRSIASRCLGKEPVLLALGEERKPDWGGAADFPRSCETRDLTHNSFRSFASAIFKLGNTVVIHSFDSIDLPGFFVG